MGKVGSPILNTIHQQRGIACEGAKMELGKSRVLKRTFLKQGCLDEWC